MPYSAYILPLVKNLPWGRAASIGQLTPVSGTDLLQPEDFSERDSELAYRDLLVAAALAQVATRAADVWQVNLPHPILPATPAGTVKSDLSDLPAVYASPGAVDHVNTQSVPIDAASVDEQLYARDALLYEILRRASTIFSVNPLTPLANSPSLVNDLWSLGDGLKNQATVSEGKRLNVDLFKRPDQDLAQRDNLLAAYVARAKDTFNRLYEMANRLLVQALDASGRPVEPEVYNLVEDTGSTRTWAADPLIPGRLRLTYDKVRRTISWLGETPGPTSSPRPATYTFTTASGGAVTLVNEVPPLNDAEFYRQKASRLPTKDYFDRIIFNTSQPNLYTLDGALWQPDSALITRPGLSAFSLPVVMPVGTARVSMLVKPARKFDVYGFQNTLGAADGTAVTLTTAQSVSWQLTLPKGRLFFSAIFTDKLTATQSFPVKVTYNGDLVYDGSWAFGKKPGTLSQTPAIEFESTGQVSLITIQWAGGPGQLTIDRLSFVTRLGDLATSYNVAAQVGTFPSQSQLVAGVAGRLDTIFFDIFIEEETAAPQLILNWTGSDGTCLYIYAYDVRYFFGTKVLENPRLYESHKNRLMGLALGSVQRAYRRSVTSQVPLPEFRTADPLYDYVWDEAANGRWVRAIQAAEPRLTTAFQVSGPGDVGRPALIPDGLELITDTLVRARGDARTGAPVLRALQPWMVEFGALVAGSDFWPLPNRACESQGVVPVLADFNFTVIDADGGHDPIIVNLTATSKVTNLPDGQNFTAYNLANTGPGGGAVEQIVYPTAWLQNLDVGTLYTLTVSLITEPASGGAGVTSTVDKAFTATAAAMSVALDPVAAALGYLVSVTAVALS